MPGNTNALNYELFAAIAEAHGQGVPLAFLFTTSTDGTAAPGAKSHALQDFLGWLAKYCPNIKFTHSDKDRDEIQSLRSTFPDAKHQCCYWHAIQYVKKRLTEDKPTTPYNAKDAHNCFNFIDARWGPGVDKALLEGSEEDSGSIQPIPTMDIHTERVRLFLIFISLLVLLLCINI